MRRAAMIPSRVLLGCEVGGRLCMGEEGPLSMGEPSLEGARCDALKPVEGKRRWPGVREGVASPTMVLQAPSVSLRYNHKQVTRSLQQIVGPPWEHRGGILVGFPDL